MTRRYAVLVLALSALWGASYMFIKVAVRQIEPAPMIELRLALAALILVGVVAARDGVGGAIAGLRHAGPGAYLLGAVNSAIPFTLIAWGEKHVDSGVAAIANSTVPIFVVLLAIRFRPSERVTGLRAVGIGVGLAGVAALTGASPGGGGWAVAGTLAVVVASVSYAVGGLWGQRLVARTGGLTLAAASAVGGAVILLPLALVQLPDAVPGAKALLSVAALAVLGTALAQIVWYRLLRLYGPARGSLVTYMLPPAALLYGVTLLGEPLTAPELGGLALVLAGVALGSGAVRLRRRAVVEA